MSHADHFKDTATTLEVLNELADDPFSGGPLALCIDKFIGGDFVAGRQLWKQLVEQAATSYGQTMDERDKAESRSETAWVQAA